MSIRQGNHDDRKVHITQQHYQRMQREAHNATQLISDETRERAGLACHRLYIEISCFLSLSFFKIFVSFFKKYIFFFSLKKCKNVGKESKKEKNHTNLLVALRDVKGV